MLFHGTSGADPSLVYTGEEGFDMRFSSGGMWGQAVYFAVNSSYSHSYSHPGAGGRQMFMADVLVGTYEQRQSDRSIKMPNLIPGRQNERYDSIMGNTGGSDVFMIYSNKKAYPSYLVTYTA